MLSNDSTKSDQNAHSQRVLYLIENNLDSIFMWAQNHNNVPCYKTRITQSQIGWVIELNKADKNHSLFLLEYSHSVTNIMGTYYV